MFWFVPYISDPVWNFTYVAYSLTSSKPAKKLHNVEKYFWWNWQMYQEVQKITWHNEIGKNNKNNTVSIHIGPDYDVVGPPHPPGGTDIVKLHETSDN